MDKRRALYAQKTQIQLYFQERKREKNEKLQYFETELKFQSRKKRYVSPPLFIVTVDIAL